VRRRYLVAYDVSDAKRLRRVFRALHGFGDPVQYSVFVCVLSRTERQLLREKLTALLHLREDRAMVVDLGEASGREEAMFEVLGRQLDAMPDEFRAVVV
jgi:CRISPR-associated protein Cas2